MESQRRRRSLGFTRPFLLLSCMLAIVGSAFADPIAPPEGAEDIAPPAGHRPYLVLHAVGTQTYTCTEAGTWSTASVPVADLFAENGKKIGVHSAGPRWELKDGSFVHAARVSGVTKDATAIAWLLLQATNKGAGADGDRLAKTTYIQRVNTVGGTAPAGPCTPGATVSVPYSADYYFYQSATE